MNLLRIISIVLFLLHLRVHLLLRQVSILGGNWKVPSLELGVDRVVSGEALVEVEFECRVPVDGKCAVTVVDGGLVVVVELLVHHNVSPDAADSGFLD